MIRYKLKILYARAVRFVLFRVLRKPLPTVVYHDEIIFTAQDGKTPIRRYRETP